MTVTHQQIAEAAGVSQPTVSRALRNHPEIKEKTREQIQKLAEEMGYRPDPAMSALAAYRSRKQPAHRYGKFAILSHCPPTDALPAHLAQTIAGIRNRAETFGLDAEHFQIGLNEEEQQQLSRILQARGIRGVIVTPLPEPPSAFDWSRFAVVGVGENAVPLQINYVSYDHDEAIATAYAQLRSRGYRNIGYYNLAASEARNRHLFLATYLKCRFLDRLKAYPPFLFEDATESPMGWIKKHRLDAVIAQAGFLEHLEGSSLRVPEEFGCAGFASTGALPDSSDFATHVIDGSRIGARAVNLLQALLQRNELGIPAPEDRSCVLVQGSWHEGGSIRPVPR